MKPRSLAVVLLAGGLICGSTTTLGAFPLPRPAAAQTGESADRDITQKIRKALMADKTLSTYAHNVKVIVHDGKVTLRGPVRSDAEQRTVADLATKVAGAGNVTDELTVQPSK
jgi:osmotically-inducible protein OsmY